MLNEVISRRAFSLTPSNLQEAMEFAKIMSESDLVPASFKTKPGNILVAVQYGSELGLAPLQALQNIAVISGRPCVWGDAILGLVQGSGLLEDMQEVNDGQTATCSVKRRGFLEYTVRHFSMDDAKKAGLAGKQGPWAQYPARMLQMRARAFALRDAFADVLKGIALREEVEDYDQEPRNITPPPAIQPPRRLSEKPQEPALEIASPVALCKEPDSPIPADEPVENLLTEAKPISEARVKRLWTIARGCGWKDQELKEWLINNYGLTSSKEIQEAQYDAIITEIQAGAGA